MHQLLERLMQIQRQVRPVWFPKRDPRANPALFEGFWGPWRKNPANSQILKDMEEKIPKNGETLKTRLGNYKNQTGVYEGHEEFHSMLHKILKDTKKKAKIKNKATQSKTKKTTISQNDESQIKHSLFTFNDAMEEKTHDKQGMSIVGQPVKRDLLPGKEQAQAINEREKRRSAQRSKKEVLQKQNIVVVKREAKELIGEENDSSANKKSKQRSEEPRSKRSNPENGGDYQDDTVSTIVQQSIEEKHELTSKGPSGDSAFNYIIQDIENDSSKKGKTVNYKRSDIPKPRHKSKKDTILNALAKFLL